MPAPFSKAMEYWKPGQPPPTTDNRNPDGTGVCCAIISLTLAIALGVSTGAAVLGCSLGCASGCTRGCTSGVVVVAICLISLGGYLYYNKASECLNKAFRRRYS